MTFYEIPPPLDETKGRRKKRKERQKQIDAQFWNICREKNWPEAKKQFNSESQPTRNQS